MPSSQRDCRGLAVSPAPFGFRLSALSRITKKPAIYNLAAVSQSNAHAWSLDQPGSLFYPSKKQPVTVLNLLFCPHHSIGKRHSFSFHVFCVFREKSRRLHLSSPPLPESVQNRRLHPAIAQQSNADRSQSHGHKHRDVNHDSGDRYFPPNPPQGG